MRSGYRYAVTAILLAAILSAQGGCSLFTAPAAKPSPLSPGHLAVIPAPEFPVVEFEGFEKSRSGGAVHTAGRTFANCLGGIGQGSCSGSFCGAVLVVGLGLCSIASVAGGVYGAVATPGPETVKSRESTMMNATYSSLVQVPLRDYVVSAALENLADIVNVPYDNNVDVGQTGKLPDYRYLAARGVDTVLEVGLTRVATEPGIEKNMLILVMEATARVVSVADGRELYHDNFRYEANESYTVEEWSAHQGKLLVTVLQNSYEPLANYIYSRIFLVYPFPDRSAKGFPVSTFGLSPVYPALSLPPFTAPFDKSSKIDSLQPILRWESFPRHEDVEKNPSDMGRVQHVRYDIRVASVNISERNGRTDVKLGKLVVDQQGLESPEYRIARPLEAHTLYVWTVRARFDLDGRIWVTEWSSQWKPGDYQMPPAPSLLSYMFRTP